MDEEAVKTLYKNQKYLLTTQNWSHKSSAENSSCGDEITLFADIESDTLAELYYTGSACSVCMASAESLARLVKGRKIEDLKVNLKSDSVLLSLGMTADEKRAACALLPYSALQEILAKF